MAKAGRVPAVSVVVAPRDRQFRVVIANEERGVAASAIAPSFQTIILVGDTDQFCVVVMQEPVDTLRQLSRLVVALDVG